MEIIRSAMNLDDGGGGGGGCTAYGCAAYGTNPGCGVYICPWNICNLTIH